MSLKNPPGIDPGTVGLVAQRLNHYATAGPFHSYNKHKFMYILCQFSVIQAPASSKTIAIAAAYPRMPWFSNLFEFAEKASLGCLRTSSSIASSLTAVAALLRSSLFLPLIIDSCLLLYKYVV
jgi:hypothetical protein